MSAAASDAFVRIGWDNTQAHQGANQLVNITQQTKQRAEKVLGSIGQGVRFAGALVGFQSAGAGIQKSLDGVKRGFDFNQVLSDSEVGVSNVLRRFDGLNKAAAKNEAAKALQRIIELEPITAGGLQDLTSGFMGTLAASKGVGLSTMQNIELVAKFANAIANAGLPLDQIRQEFRSIITGTITKDSQIAKILGITNEDINKLRGNGDALFSFLVAKLGEFGEAGDSATVAFSSMNSALDKALGGMTEQLFELAVRGAKQLTTQLQDPAWVAQMREAGVDIARTAESLSQVGLFILAWVPTVAKLGARLAGLGPSLAAIGIAIAAMKLGTFIQNKIAAGSAAEKAAQSLRQETAALTANTAAQNANAAAAKGNAGARVITNAAGKQMIVAPGQMFGTSLLGLVTNEGSKAGKGFVAGFKSAFRTFPQTVGGQMLAGLNGMGPLMLGTLSTMFLDRSQGIAGRIGGKLGGDVGSSMAPAIMDGVSLFLSALGPYGALAGVAVQLIDGAAALGTQMGEAMAETLHDLQNPATAALGRTGGAMPRILGRVDKGEEHGARQDLENALVETREKYNRAVLSGSQADQVALSLELQMLEDMQRNWEQIVASGKAAADERSAAAAAAADELEAAARREKEQDDKRIAAWREVHSLARDISTLKLDMMSDADKLKALGQQMRQLKQDAAIIGGISGPVTPESIMDKADSQKKAGNSEGAARTLEFAKQLLELMKQIGSLEKNIAEDAATAKAKQKAVEQSREEFDLETQIVQAKAAAGDEEAESVKAMEDQLAIKRLALQLEERLNLSADEALAKARQRVEAERALGSEVERRQKLEDQRRQDESLSDLAGQFSVLRAQAAGDDEQARRLQRELDIRREAKQIAESTGLPEERALAIAREKARLEEQAAQQAERKRQRDDQTPNGGRSKIHGYSRTRGQEGVGFGRKADGALADITGPLWDRQRKHEGPLAQRAVENAAGKGGAPGTRTMEQKLDEMIAVTRLGLLGSN